MDERLARPQICEENDKTKTGDSPMPSLFPWFKKNATATRPQRNGDSIRTLPSTEFAFRLFENLNPGERNLAVCPYGARVLLSMLWEGSTGETRKEMSEALHFNTDPNSSGNCYERLGRPLGYQLKTERRGLQMLTANSLWCDDRFAPKEEYVKTLQEHYWAESKPSAFVPPTRHRRSTAGPMKKHTEESLPSSAHYMNSRRWWP